MARKTICYQHINELVSLEGIPVSNFKNWPKKGPVKWPEKRPEKRPGSIELPFRVTKANGACSVWVLHCSTSTENVLYGGDMFRMADATGGDWDVVGTGATLFMAEEQWTAAPHAVAGHAYVHRFNVQVGLSKASEASFWYWIAKGWQILLYVSELLRTGWTIPAEIFRIGSGRGRECLFKISADFVAK